MSVVDPRDTTQPDYGVKLKQLADEIQMLKRYIVGATNLDKKFRIPDTTNPGTALAVLRLNAARTDLEFGPAVDGGSVISVPWSTGVTGKPTTIAGYGITDGATVDQTLGRLLAVRVFTTANNGQTYIPTAGTNSVVVEVQAPGGGGGGSVTCAAGQTSIAGGGGAGGYGKARFSSGFSGVVVTIPGGGAGGAVGAAGATAATASFGALLSCTGGVGGSQGYALSTTAYIGSAASGNAIGANLQAYSAPPGSFGYSLGNGWFSGFGAFSLRGPGANGVGGTQPGSSPATGYGGGGSGAATGQSTAGQAGGAGAPACITVWEFA